MNILIIISSSFIIKGVITTLIIINIPVILITNIITITSRNINNSICNCKGLTWGDWKGGHQLIINESYWTILLNCVVAVFTLSLAVLCSLFLILFLFLVCVCVSVFYFIFLFLSACIYLSIYIHGIATNRKICKIAILFSLVLARFPFLFSISLYVCVCIFFWASVCLYVSSSLLTSCFIYINLSVDICLYILYTYIFRKLIFNFRKECRSHFAKRRLKNSTKENEETLLWEKQRESKALVSHVHYL